MIEVKVHVAYITVRGESKRLTKAIAKQFPVKGDRSTSAMRGTEEPEPLCKINAATIDKDYTGWFLLVPDPIAGLVWTRPADFREDFLPSVLDRGGWYDNMEAIPTVIL